MASYSEKDLTCPICCDIFKEAVVLSCSHSFCKACVLTWWREKGINECPVCKERPLSEPTVSLALKNLCEAFLREKTSEASEAICKLHEERLKLFCLEHQQPVCVICRDSKEHKNHSFRPIDEAAQHLKQELQIPLSTLKNDLKLIEKAIENNDQTAKHIKVQTRKTERQIKEEFKKLYKFLQEEEKARVMALQEEEKQKSRVVREKTEELSRKMAAISDLINTTEKEVRSADVIFLKNYKATLNTVQQSPLLDEPQLVAGALIDEAKHLGNLTFNIWDKMKDVAHYSPVMVDPNTAHSELIVSDDLTAVRREHRQKLPDNQERLSFYLGALGSEGFVSGSHSWDVEVGVITNWALGVAAESIQRKVNITSGLWLIECRSEKLCAFSPPNSRIFLKVKIPKRVRVHLDCDRRTAAFSDPDTETHIYTFSHNYTGKIYPYFSNQNKEQLKIQQIKVSVTVKQPYE